jgi:CII-binding regulator of phage lambda lysogenization HflD
VNDEFKKERLEGRIEDLKRFIYYQNENKKKLISVLNKVYSDVKTQSGRELIEQALKEMGYED